MSVATAQPTNISETHVWPEEGATRIPDWVYTSQEIYELEVERIFRGKTWNYVALEVEIPNPGDFKRSHVGPISVLVTRCKDGSIAVVENRCAHRGDHVGGMRQRGNGRVPRQKHRRRAGCR